MFFYLDTNVAVAVGGTTEHLPMVDSLTVKTACTLYSQAGPSGITDGGHASGHQCCAAVTERHRNCCANNLTLEIHEIRHILCEMCNTLNQLVKMYTCLIFP